MCLQRWAGSRRPTARRLPQTGTLSDIVVSDGKVFFSIRSMPRAVQAWEPVRKQRRSGRARGAGVQSAMVALTAERRRRRRGADRAPRGIGRRPRHGKPRRAASRRPAGVPGVAVDHRGRLGQGRRRQIHHRDQSGARACAISA